MRPLALGAALAASATAVAAAAQQYQLGLGIGDITGPVVETNMMGYASLAQTDTGLHMRQRARAFIVAAANTTTATDRILFINIDVGMGDSGIRRGIINALKTTYGGIYTEQNTAIVATHAHSGVGGYVENLLPQLTSLGFVQQAYDAMVAGALVAVKKAHNSLALGTLSIGNTTLLNANINRSGFSYDQNPAEERALYEYNQDKDFSLLHFKDTSGNSRGFMSFFAVHGTSLYENNTLVSGDNKGMAAYLYESSVEPNSAPGNTTYVAGFIQSNVGDTSPNVLGAYCEDPGEAWDGQECDYRTSTCGNKTEPCHGRGPGFRDDAYGFSSNAIIGNLQYGAAKTLTASSLTAVSGSVRSIHQYVLMDNYAFTLPNGTNVTTCPAAMGYSFAGGTTDGPGAFDFTQADNNTVQNPLWEIVKTVVTPAPSAAQIACHYPKPILLNTGYATWPYNWTVHSVDIQILRVGQVVMLVMPGEFTTMAGRRIRNAVRTQLISQGVIDNSAYVVIAGPANTYGHYVTTQEEYNVQRYEGASTLFGPNTLAAYTDIYTKLVPWLNTTVPSTQPKNAAAPPNQISEALSLTTGVVVDGSGSNDFGDVLVQPKASYTAGQTVLVTFQAANPRNNLHLEGTYLSIDRQNGSTFSQYRTDSHPSTTFSWLRTGCSICDTSEVNVTWTIESGTPAGTYRVRYFGDSKSLFGTITPFTGTSNTFTVS